MYIHDKRSQVCRFVHVAVLHDFMCVYVCVESCYLFILHYLLNAVMFQCDHLVFIGMFN